MFKSPSNREEYWGLVYEHWDDITCIIDIYLPTFHRQWIDKTKLDKTLGEYIFELKETKNDRLARIFSAAFWACPEEDAGEWKHKSWDVLVGLCQDEYVLIEEKEKENE